MRRISLLLLMFSMSGGIVFSQTKWSDLSKKDIAKRLNDSAWGQSQAVTDVSQLMFSPTASPTSPAARSTEGNSTRSSAITGVGTGTADPTAGQGASNQAQSVNYRIRFLSAKPIREAFSAYLLQLQPAANRQAMIPQMQEFVDRDFGDYIVIAVSVDATDRRFSGPVEQLLASSTGETLKNETYLERKDGKRLFLLDYRPPGKDGMGAKFVFERTKDGAPFITPEAETVRFVSEINNKVKMNMKFKVADMMYDGKLEY